MQPFERGLIWQSIAWVRACGAVNSRGGLESLVFTLRYILWCQQSMLGCLRLIPMHACMLSENRAWFAHVRDLLPLLCMQKRFPFLRKSGKDFGCSSSEFLRMVDKYCCPK